MNWKWMLLGIAAFSMMGCPGCGNKTQEEQLRQKQQTLAAVAKYYAPPGATNIEQIGDGEKWFTFTLEIKQQQHLFLLNKNTGQIVQINDNISISN